MPTDTEQKGSTIPQAVKDLVNEPIKPAPNLNKEYVVVLEDGLVRRSSTDGIGNNLLISNFVSLNQNNTTRVDFANFAPDGSMSYKKNETFKDGGLPKVLTESIRYDGATLIESSVSERFDRREEFTTVDGRLISAKGYRVSEFDGNNKELTPAEVAEKIVVTGGDFKAAKLETKEVVFFQTPDETRQVVFTPNSKEEPLVQVKSSSNDKDIITSLSKNEVKELIAKAEVLRKEAIARAQEIKEQQIALLKTTKQVEGKTDQPVPVVNTGIENPGLPPVPIKAGAGR